MPETSSDSDASPKSPVSSSSSDEERRRPSDESGSSDGVLVELPGNADHDSRSPPGHGGRDRDGDGGILVNIDGSMLENAEENDAAREETFVDAPDQLGGRGVDLGESVAVIEFGEGSSATQDHDLDAARLRARLEETVAECRKYKEEREVFGREVSSLLRQLEGVFDRQSMVAGGSEELVEHMRRLEKEEVEDKGFSSPTPLHSMLGDCFKFVGHLRTAVDEQVHSEGAIRELHDILYAKDQDIEDLHVKESESSVSRDVIVSYLGSLMDVWLKSFGSEIQQLGQCLVDLRPGFVFPQENELGFLFYAAREELLDSKRKESYCVGRISQLEEENKMIAVLKESLDQANAEASKTKMELEQAESKLAATKEKLSIAVTKGKSLVQHRDALKQSLAEKTNELEKCFLELQQKSDALVAAEASAEELQQSLAEKTSELDKCLQELQQKSDSLEAAEASVEELNNAQNLVLSLQDLLSQKDMVFQEIEEAMLQADCPPELLSLEAVDKVRWFVNEKHNLDCVFLELQKARDSMSTIGLPEDISSMELEFQIQWLWKSFSQSKEDIIKLQDKITAAQDSAASHESHLSEVRNEINQLAASLSEGKQEKESIQDELKDIRSRYEGITETLSTVSSEKDGLMKLLLEISESTLDDQHSLDTDSVIERCRAKIREKMETSPIDGEPFQRIQSLLYIRDQELMLCQRILEEEIIDRSDMVSLSTELGRVSEEVVTMRNEKCSLQKELERVEEKSALLREKLSMAVKKGKGLVQEREGLKASLDEKSAEIEKLKEELRLQDLAIIEHKEQIKALSANTENIQKLESDIVLLNEQKDQIERSLQESNNSFQRVFSSISEIGIPTNKVFEEPMGKLNQITEYIHELEAAQVDAVKELERLKDKDVMQTSRIAEAYTTIKSLEDELSHAQERLAIFVEEKKDTEVGRTSVKQELERIKEEAYLQASKLEEAYASIKSLEDALALADKNISLLKTEKSEIESKFEQEIITLNANFAECTKELAGAWNNFENQSAELSNHLGDLQTFVKDDGLASLMTDGFRTVVEDLTKINLLIQDMHSQFAEKGSCTHPSLRQHPGTAEHYSLPKFEDYMVQSGTSTVNLDDAPSFTKLVEGFHGRAKLLRSTCEGFSRYMDDYVALTVQALQGVSDELKSTLELSEFLKLHINNLESHNEIQEVKISSLQTEMKRLLSACTEATQGLQVDFSDVSDILSDLHQFSSSLKGEPQETIGAVIREGDDGECAKAAEVLVLAARRVKNQFQQLADLKGVCVDSIDDLKSKLQQAELTAETATQDKHLIQKRMFELEGDLVSLRNVCSELRVQIKDYQAKEDMLREKEAELFSLQSSLTEKGEGMDDKLFLERQMEILFNKVYSMEIPFQEIETDSQQVNFSSPINKLSYILDKVSLIHNNVVLLMHEKEDAQLILASHAREVEHMRKDIEINKQNLESKDMQLTEFTIGLDRIIQRLGGNDSSEDKKFASAMEILSLLERLIGASSLEFENSKSRVQELGSKLQAKEKLVDELSAKIKFLEDSSHSQIAQPDIVKERTVFEASSAMGSEISEIEDVGPPGKSSIPPVPAAAHVRTMRKGSSDHLVLTIDPESNRLITAQEIDDKGHVFKSLNTSGLIPKQGKLIADRIDGIWVSGGRILMSKPGARLGLIAYWLLLHIWVLGTIL